MPLVPLKLSLRLRLKEVKHMTFVEKVKNTVVTESIFCLEVLIGKGSIVMD